MSQTSAPFGLRVAYHNSGFQKEKQGYGLIASAYASNIYIGQPVTFNTSGALIPVSSTSDEWVGAFNGVSFTPAGGRPQYGYWPASTSLAANVPTDVHYNDDPFVIYDVQADGSVAQSAIGAVTNFTNLTANDGNGYSRCTVSSTLVAAGSTGQFRILGLAPIANNNWGDPFVVVRGIVGLHLFTGNKAGN